MTIKSDRWIRRMAEEHGMIEPFEPGQVRYVDNKKVISYGTSSYGYDIRCADEFKVFTNINSTIVDPKDFDPASFVEVRCLYHSSQFVRSRTHGGVLPDSPECAYGVPREVDLCAMRHHRERDAV